MAIVQTLDSEVSDENLFLLGELKFKVHNEDGFRTKIELKSATNGFLRTLDGTEFYSGSSGDSKLGEKVSGNNITVFCGTETTDVSLFNKYDISELSFDDPWGVDFDLLDLDYCIDGIALTFKRIDLKNIVSSKVLKKCSKFRCTEGNFSLDISEFASNNIIDSILFNNNDGITGSVLSLANKVLLSGVNLDGCPNVSGSHDEFFDALYANGKVSGRCSVRLADDNYDWKIADFTSSGWTLV